MILFSLVPFWVISLDARVIKLNGVKSKGRGAEKETEKTMKPIRFDLKLFQGSVLIKAIQLLLARGWESSGSDNVCA